MIDFNEIKKKVSTIKDFIGGEKYITLKKNNSINVFNKYDPNSNQLLTNKQKLLIYQTDDPFDKNKEWLCEKYNKIYSVNNKILINLNIISLPLGIVDTAETISFATCYKKRDFSLFNLLCECRDNFNEEPQKTLYLNYRIPPNFKIREDAHSIIKFFNPYFWFKYVYICCSIVSLGNLLSKHFLSKAALLLYISFIISFVILMVRTLAVVPVIILAVVFAF